MPKHLKNKLWLHHKKKKWSKWGKIEFRDIKSNDEKGEGHAWLDEIDIIKVNHKAKTSNKCRWYLIPYNKYLYKK